MNMGKIFLKCKNVQVKNIHKGASSKQKTMLIKRIVLKSEYFKNYPRYKLLNGILIVRRRLDG